MTFALVRAGLPNSVVMLALAMVPVVAIAMAAGERTHLAGARSPAIAMVSSLDAASAEGQAIAE
jgi:hypothetical protein